MGGKKQSVVVLVLPEGYLNCWKDMKGERAGHRDIHGGALARGKESSFNWDSKLQGKECNRLA